MKNGHGVPRNGSGAVVKALRDPRWDFRTAEGIGKATRMPAQEVEAILRRLVRTRIARVSPAPAPDGRPLFALARRPVTVRERLSLVQHLFSNLLVTPAPDR
jgi:hypothetical protein